MPRLSSYLLALLLSFLASVVWFSYNLKNLTPALTTFQGRSTCSSGAGPASALILQTSPISEDIESGSPKETMPLKSISSPYYLPISSSHQLFLTPFPSKLWQKVGPKGIDVDGQSYIESWHKQSPSLRHEILTDDSAEQYVREQFAALPDIRDTYLALQVPILKADLLRQLILYMEGGIWSDMDVTCLAPIDSWVPMVHQGRTNLVVGLEFDGSQFASWTIMAKPRSVHIAMAIGYIMDALASSAAQHNTNIAGLTMKTITDVVDVTGPQAMTRAILDSLSIQMEAPVGRSNISNLLEPTLLHDVLVLPNAAFAAMQGGWPKNHGPYLVEHHYAGSWKNEKGGEVVER